MLAQQHISHYEILEKIASGGQATVYRARDLNLGRIVALKVLHPHLADDPQFRERFLREARTAASLTHPNVVTVFDVGEEAGQLFLAMEYLPSSLHDLMRDRGRLRPEHAIDITLQVARALHAGHQRGIVHRDLKPQNILLTEEGIPQVADYGIARAMELGTMTATGAVMGTPEYMSPEQAKGERVDIRSDLYSLGIILYGLIIGHTPLEGRTPQEIVRHHLLDQDASQEALENVSIPSRVTAVLRRMLAKDTAARYQTPQELFQALERGLSSTNVETFSGVKDTEVVQASSHAGDTNSNEAVHFVDGASRFQLSWWRKILSNFRLLSPEIHIATEKSDRTILYEEWIEYGLEREKGHVIFVGERGDYVQYAFDYQGSVLGEVGASALEEIFEAPVSGSVENRLVHYGYQRPDGVDRPNYFQYWNDPDPRHLADLTEWVFREIYNEHEDFEVNAGWG